MKLALSRVVPLVGLLLTAWACDSSTYGVDLELGSGGDLTITWGEPVLAMPEIPCVQDAHRLDPDGSRTQWLANEGIQADLTGWAEPGTGSLSDRCWLYSEVTFANLADWNAYVPYWTTHLANNLDMFEGTYFFRAFIPGAIQTQTLQDDSLSIAIGLEVYEGMLAKYGYILNWVEPGTGFDLRVTAPCPVVSATPAAQSDISGNTAIFHLDELTSFPQALTLTTTPGCSFG